MKITSKVVLVGALAFAMLAAVLVLGPGTAGAASLGNQALLQQGNPTATAAPSTSGSSVQQADASLVQEWDRFCVKKVPYTLLALPENASYEVAPFEGTMPTIEPGAVSPSEFSCTTAGIFRGQQVVVCKGPQLTSFTLRVSADGASEDFPVGLTWCPIKEPSTYRNAQ